jgi:hypothetical protein
VLDLCGTSYFEPAREKNSWNALLPRVRGKKR